MVIRVSKSCIGSDEQELVSKVLTEEFLGMGTYTKQFEDELELFFENKTKVVSCSSGTAALQIALQAIGANSKSEVIVPTLTYVASIQAITATGATPIFCDVDEEGQISLEDLENKITDKTIAVMPVHFASFTCDLDSLHSIAKSRGIRVVEDAAHAFGSFYKKQKVGTFGDVICFSFDGIKNITCGEGGCVVSKNLDEIEIMRDIRLLAVCKDSDRRVVNERSTDFDVLHQGWRYHLSNINAAIGIVQLSRFDELSKKRKYVKEIYDQGLEGNKKIAPLLRKGIEITPHIYVVQCLNGELRDLLRKSLSDKNIQTAIHYPLNHHLTKFRAKETFPQAELLNSRILTLPMHPDLTNEEVNKVLDTISEISS
mgnify:CR=1 FL=1